MLSMNEGCEILPYCSVLGNKTHGMYINLGEWVFCYNFSTFINQDSKSCPIISVTSVMHNNPTPQQKCNKDTSNRLTMVTDEDLFDETDNDGPWNRWSKGILLRHTLMKTVWMASQHSTLHLLLFCSPFLAPS
jgi:hypothetical protein